MAGNSATHDARLRRHPTRERAYCHDQVHPGFHACCITHENGVLHVRSTTEGFPCAGRARPAPASTGESTSLTTSTPGAAVIRDITVELSDCDDHRSIDEIGMTLRSAGIIAHNYVPYYDTHGKGPAVSFTESARPRTRHKTLGCSTSTTASMPGPGIWAIPSDSNRPWRGPPSRP